MPPTAAPCLIYITARDKAEALALGRQLVERRLAACINVLGGMTSIYRWEGRLEEAQEAVLIAKTDRSRADELIAELKKLHSYSVPCALILDVQGGNPDYLCWLAEGLQ
jgi:periplasmic divalent cation tolerance protein